MDIVYCCCYLYFSLIFSRVYEYLLPPTFDLLPRMLNNFALIMDFFLLKIVAFLKIMTTARVCVCVVQENNT